MQSVAEVLKCLAKIKRERALVESASIADNVKARLLAELKAKEAALGSEPEGSPSGSGKGK